MHAVLSRSPLLQWLLTEVESGSQMAYETLIVRSRTWRSEQPWLGPRCDTLSVHLPIDGSQVHRTTFCIAWITHASRLCSHSGPPQRLPYCVSLPPQSSAIGSISCASPYLGRALTPCCTRSGEHNHYYLDLNQDALSVDADGASSRVAA